MDNQRNIVLEILAAMIIIAFITLIATIFYMNKKEEKNRDIFADKVNSIYEIALQYYQNQDSNISYYILENSKLIDQNQNKIIHEDTFWDNLSGHIIIEISNNDKQIILEIENDEWSAINLNNGSDLVISKK